MNLLIVEDFADVDKALKDFYENAIHEAIKKNAISEDNIREWCEKKLITSNGTRGIVFQGDKITEGIPNEIIDRLEDKYLIKTRNRIRWNMV